MANYVILNNDYLATDYVDSNYVGTDSDLYVEAGYIQDAIEASASVNAVATTSVNAGKLQLGTTTLASASTLTINGTVERRGTSTVLSSASVQTVSSVVRDATLSINGVLNANISAVATVSPGAAITVASTLSATPTVTRTFTADLRTAGDEVTFDDAGTWGESTSDIWGPLFDVSAVRTLGQDLVYTIPFVSTLTAAGDRTAIASITVDSFATMAVSATRVSSATLSLNTTATLQAQGVINTGVVNQVISANTTMSVSGIFVTGGRATINAQATTTIDGDRIARGTTTQSAQAQQTLTGDNFRIRGVSADLQSNFTTSIQGSTTGDGIVLKASSATLTVRAKQLHGAFQDVQSANFTFFCNGGRLRDGSSTMTAFNTVLGAITIFNIDPFRVYIVDNELRICQIEQDTRFFTVYSENRVNTIEAETRTKQVPSQSRTLIVQPTKLIETAGTLDRRE
jgi:hypothetical protein